MQRNMQQQQYAANMRQHAKHVTNMQEYPQHTQQHATHMQQSKFAAICHKYTIRSNM